MLTWRMSCQLQQRNGISTDTPGVGVGGHCIPVDPYYMIQRAADVGVPAELITAAEPSTVPCQNSWLMY